MAERVATQWDEKVVFRGIKDRVKERGVEGALSAPGVYMASLDVTNDVFYLRRVQDTTLHSFLDKVFGKPNEVSCALYAPSPDIRCVCATVLHHPNAPTRCTGRFFLQLVPDSP